MTPISFENVYSAGSSIAPTSAIQRCYSTDLTDAPPLYRITLILVTFFMIFFVLLFITGRGLQIPPIQLFHDQSQERGFVESFRGCRLPSQAELAVFRRHVPLPRLPAAELANFSQIQQPTSNSGKIQPVFSEQKVRLALP